MSSGNPRINDVMLAEAIRQLLPVAELGVRAVKTSDLIPPFRRAEALLGLWTKQGRGRVAKLDGPLPLTPSFEPGYFIEVLVGDPGQSVPKECEPRRPRRKISAIEVKKEA